MTELLTSLGYGDGMATFLANVSPHHDLRTTGRADVLALIDESIRVCRKNSLEDHHFQALRDKIAGGLHERNAT